MQDAKVAPIILHVGFAFITIRSPVVILKINGNICGVLIFKIKVYDGVTPFFPDYGVIVIGPSKEEVSVIANPMTVPI